MFSFWQNIEREKVCKMNEENAKTCMKEEKISFLQNKNLFRKNSSSMIIVLVTGTCDFVIGDWCWCFGIANFGSPMIAWWRLSNLSSFVLALEHSQTQHPIHDVFFSKNISHFYAKIVHICFKNVSHFCPKIFQFFMQK